MSTADRIKDNANALLAIELKLSQLLPTDPRYFAKRIALIDARDVAITNGIRLCQQRRAEILAE
jgi:hypothetical protein